MKLQIDTSNKIIRLLEDVEIGHMIDTLKQLFPHKEWKSFTIQYAGDLAWKDVIYVPYRYDPPVYPWYITTGETETTTNAYSMDLKPGIYNVETTELQSI